MRRAIDPGDVFFLEAVDDDLVDDPVAPVLHVGTQRRRAHTGRAVVTPEGEYEEERERYMGRKTRKLRGGKSTVPPGCVPPSSRSS